ncbi:M81 family metallopeptidase [Parapusillimonas granuli]|uniref:Microcystinase C n=1 Tax=Parapusillimonas granuli TaxID=380911 RepID=A0A853FT46_9BURK|nr:M81 family metallopeptidase [Parapusillimonas granuli]MBB5214518.1 microcystin degradation protein MlrC [Parapusillimonas granuli]MEB2398233.1 M81 family metallopeptidase [Alcaligenaceae bacterium]NYT49074.1 M81 family metallopeptidase [Parapusillimonas granuli]
MKPKRLAVARFWYEGNAFSPAPAGMPEFEQYEWMEGPSALELMRGTAHELGAVAAFADAHPDWEVVVLRCAAALPAGPIDDAVFERFIDELRQGLQAGQLEGGWDAVYLSLHGAAITGRRETPELEIARMVRGLLPETPLGASFDLHGNLPPEWAGVLDYASAYRTHPHIDMAETAARVLAALSRMAGGGLQTRKALLNERIVLPSINMRTAAGPMRLLEEVARDAAAGAVLDVSVFGGFPYSDTAHTGASVFAVSDASRDPTGAEAAAAAETVMARIRASADQFRIRLPSAEDALAAALADTRPGLIAVTDSGDNPLSGGGGDTPGLFRALVAARPDVPALFASFADPDTVRAALAAGVGAGMDVALGGRHGPQFGAGVHVRAVVERLTDGEFRNTGPMMTGITRSCGQSVLLRLEDTPSVRVIVTERITPADDPAFYALHGVDPARLRLLCVKAKNHFRAAFAERCIDIIDCDVPGPACQDLTRLPFRHTHIQAS